MQLIVYMLTLWVPAEFILICEGVQNDNFGIDGLYSRWKPVSMATSGTALTKIAYEQDDSSSPENSLKNVKKGQTPFRFPIMIICVGCVRYSQKQSVSQTSRSVPEDHDQIGIFTSISIAVTRHQDQTQLGEERIQFSSQLVSYHRGKPVQ